MPIGPIYRHIIARRNQGFDSGSSPIYDLGAHTISVGNLTAGGTGKTPLVISIATTLASRGKRVCILTRGYGRPDPKKRVLVSDGKTLLTDSQTGGDEPVEMALKLLGKAIVIADADRIAAAQWAKDEFGVTDFVLDDAFQHRQAKRDVDIVCIDATDPFAGGKMLPFGRLREPAENLIRAGIVVITRANVAKHVNELRRQITAYAPNAAIFEASSKLSEMVMLSNFLSTGEHEAIDLQQLAHSKAFAFCGIGNPDAFFSQLNLENFEIVESRAFRDHYWYKQRDANSLSSKAAAAGARLLVTTAKDAVKLSRLKFEIPCYVIKSETVIDDRTTFESML